MMASQHLASEAFLPLFWSQVSVKLDLISKRKELMERLLENRSCGISLELLLLTMVGVNINMNITEEPVKRPVKATTPICYLLDHPSNTCHK